MSEIRDYSVNPDPQTAQRWPEGMAMSAVNDTGRVDEGIIARWYRDTRGDLLSTGAANAYTVTPSRDFTDVSSGYDGLGLVFQANFTNTGSATLAAGTISATTIIDNDGGNDLVGGEIQSGSKIAVIHNGTNWVLVGFPPGRASVTATGSTTPRTLSDRAADVFHVKDYGAVGDGVTDDTAAIQAAVDAAEAVGGTVVLSNAPDFFNISEPIVVRGPVTIESDGSLIRNTKLTDNPVSSTNCFLFGNNSPTQTDTVTSFVCSAITQGDDVVTSATATGIAAGDPVWIKSTKNHVSIGTIRDFYQLNKVTAINGNDYSMLHLMDESVIAPLMQPANTSEVQGLLGNDLFVAQNVVVKGVSMKSDVGRPISRGGALDCRFHFASIEGLDGLFGNGWTNCVWDIDQITVNRKIQDMAMGAAGNTVRVSRADYIDTGEDSESQIRIGENSRDNNVHYGVVNLGDKAFSNPAVLLDFTRRNVVTIDTLIAQGLANNVVNFANIVETPDQPVTVDNSVKFGAVEGGDSLTRFVNYTNAGGQNFRNHVLGGSFSGTVSVAAMTVVGEGHVISPDCIFQNGGLELQSGAARCRVYGTFKDWLTAIGSDAHLSNELRIWSDKQQDAKEHSVYTQFINNVNTTTPNTIQYTTGDIPAGTLIIRSNLKPRIRIRAKGSVIGTTATKFITLADDGGSITDFTIAAGTEGAFELEAELIVLDNTRYDVWSDLDATRDLVARTGLDLVNNTTKIDLQAWVTNAADTIRFVSVTMLIDVGTNLELESG